jgi:hypothetical protein
VAKRSEPPDPASEIVARLVRETEAVLEKMSHSYVLRSDRRDRRDERLVGVGRSVVMRVHVVMPDELVAEIDARVGKRGRSRFASEAIAEKLRRERMLQAFDEAAGSLADVDIPGWETPESTVEWVRAMRREGRDHWREAELRDLEEAQSEAS